MLKFNSAYLIFQLYKSIDKVIKPGIHRFPAGLVEVGS